MSLKVAFFLNPRTSPADWALFSDEHLSRDLDWNLNAVHGADVGSVEHHDEVLEVVGYHSAIWVYDVNPMILVDDLLHLLSGMMDSWHFVRIAINWGLEGYSGFPDASQGGNGPDSDVRAEDPRGSGGRTIPVSREWLEFPYKPR